MPEDLLQDNSNDFDYITNNEFDELEEKSLAEELSDIKEPFDPKDIDIQAVQTTFDTLIKRLEYNEIDLNPDFQRSANLWNSEYMSRLIESLLIRFPLPAFYFDASDDESWQVVDGLQRLSAIKRFVVDKKLSLKNLEFLSNYNGYKYDDLPRSLQRRIDESQVTLYLIRPGTPLNVKFSLFYRINTGGLQLKPQEIRHALSQSVNNGKASSFLKYLTETEQFKSVCRVSGKRMLDRELVLRYISFKITPLENYKAPMINFLNTSMEKLGNLDDTDLNILKNDFIKSLDLAYEIFGEDAFRKSLVENTKVKVINRALFECVSVIFSEVSNSELQNLINQKELFLDEFKLLLLENRDFYDSITFSTSEYNNVSNRFKSINDLVSKYK
ncbi:DUF262 domain-containing protein [Empedobacter brevis]|uniref:DUF262 domain-containing protein n=1 Tax=Empedobacter brevis TaxID=247 RepID=UPI0028A06099|nr:DUF262 domain-containing protein [Empedobacter brevis]